MLSDDEASRIEAQAAGADRATLARWVRALVEDRRARTGLLLGQARRLAHARKRLRQAHDYLDGLLRGAQEEAGAAFPGRLPCPQCGAPTSQVRAEQRPVGHAIVHEHADGVRCDPAAHVNPAAGPERPKRRCD